MSPTRIQSRGPRSPFFLAARDNPLCVAHVTRVKFRFAKDGWPGHLARLRELGFRASIVGPQGSGKTTLLSELAEQLRDANIRSHHLFLPQDREDHPKLVQRAIGHSSEGGILLVDGIERLSLPARWSLLKRTRSSAGLVVNLHRPCRFPERLPIWISTSTSLDLMAQILKELGLDIPEIQLAAADAFTRRNGNIRDALRDLYDQFASGRFNTILSE